MLTLKKSPKKTAKKAPKKPFDIYQTITDLICEQIAQGVAPWNKPRLTVDLGAGSQNRAINMVSKKPYEGINALILGCNPYNVPIFLTFNQAKDLGGTVRKGARSLPVVFWQKLKTEKDSGDQKERAPFVLKYYNVFNVVETDLDYSAFLAPKPVETEPTEAKIIPSCEAISEGYAGRPLLVHHDQERMFYSPSRDIVNMPNQERFKDPQEYYHVLFHELIHSTGHSSRLDREGFMQPVGFGSPSYSREELTAELGAAFLSSVAGIDTPELITNSAAYLKGWLGVLKTDKKFLFTAAASASKATKYILGETYAEAA